METLENKIFWKDRFNGEAKGGIFYRAFDLIKFLNFVEKEKGDVVGLKFDGNNLEVIYEERR